MEHTAARGPGQRRAAPRLRLVEQERYAFLYPAKIGPEDLTPAPTSARTTSSCF